MADIAAVHLHLRPRHRDVIPTWLGRAAHAFFLDALRTVHPELSALVHDAAGIKPFTISSLQHDHPRGELITLRPDHIYRLRLTTLHRDLTCITLNALLPRWLEEGIRLHDQPFHVEAAVADAATDSWTGITTYADLQAALPITGRTLKFVFASPTSFHKTGDMNFPLPTPEHVFGSLSDRWTHFSGETFPTDFKAQAAGIEVDHYQIRTERISFERAGRGTFTGFTGDVTYRLRQGDADFKARISRLAAFAVYAGVGARTPMGLGQTRAVIATVPQFSGRE